MPLMSAISERLYTAARLRQLDAAAIEAEGIGGYELMCRAGQAVVDATQAAWPDARVWVVLCGAGNNAGDGYVIARLARELGMDLRVVALRDPAGLGGDAARAAADWQSVGGEVAGWNGAIPDAADVVVDALLGTGLDRQVEGEWRAAIEAANSLDLPRVAVDIPSGLGADTGAVMGAAFRADLTVTFIGRKRGLYTADGPDHAGRVRFDRLATPRSIHQAIDADGDRPGTLLDTSILPFALPPRPRNAHKGRFGHVLVVGGNAGMGGAARLAGEGALRAGAGRVSVGTHPVHAHWLNLARPELMTQPLSSVEDMAPVLQAADVVAVGPGLGTDAWAEALLRACFLADVPLVADADALNLLSRAPAQREHWVITPHPGEAARLLDRSTGDVQADRVAAALELADRYRAVTVLKGCGTVVATPGGEWGICRPGNPGMATAGCGDVLTGVAAAMLAQGLAPEEAARCAAVAHAAAGDAAAARGERGMLAGDLCERLPEVLNG